MLGLPKAFIIFDMEWTTWEGAQERKWSGQNEYREITQIGSILVDGDTLQESAHSLLFVKPVKNPVVSEYFTTLTGITQQEIDEEGTSLSLALRKLEQFADGHDLFCFGGDMKVIAENCTLLGISSTIPPERFHNIKELFQKHGVDTTGYMSSTIVEAFGTKSDHPGHNGLNDARTVLDALRLLAEKR